jgi:hypothetical protein
VRIKKGEGESVRNGNFNDLVDQTVIDRLHRREVQISRQILTNIFIALACKSNEALHTSKRHAIHN